MQRIATTTKVVDLFGVGKHGFKDGDLALGVRATDLNADWFNGHQEEVANAIEESGQALSAGDLRQLAKAISTQSIDAATRYRSVALCGCAGLIEL